MRPGESFENADVAEYYRYRPKYPDDVYTQLVELSPHTNRVLDLGCGTGKIARGLSKSFHSVTAIDASAAMLRVARELPGGDANNVTWIQGLAESVDTGESFDLVVAAASIHWMDHSILFPRLLEVTNSDYVFAIVNGDGAHEPPWGLAWDEFLAKWILILRGEHYETDRIDSDFERHMTRHRGWIDVGGESVAECDVTQSVDQFIMCQHSRDTFAPSKMGSHIDQFDRELREILEPHADGKMIAYTVRTRIEWGKIRSAAQTATLD